MLLLHHFTFIKDKYKIWFSHENAGAEAARVGKYIMEFVHMLKSVMMKEVGMYILIQKFIAGFIIEVASLKLIRNMQ